MSGFETPAVLNRSGGGPRRDFFSVGGFFLAENLVGTVPGSGTEGPEGLLEEETAILAVETAILEVECGLANFGLAWEVTLQGRFGSSSRKLALGLDGVLVVLAL